MCKCDVSDDDEFGPGDDEFDYISDEYNDVGKRVVVRQDAFGIHKGQEGVVIASRFELNPEYCGDEYMVRFSNGDEETYYRYHLVFVE